MARRKYKIQDNKDQLFFSFRRRISWKNKPLVLILATLILGFSVRASWKVYKNREESLRLLSESENHLKDLEGREGFLNTELERLATDEGKQGELRKKFGLAFPGENVAIIVESQTKEEDLSSQSLWYKIKVFFLNLF